ncbi:DUF7689 domain-containing protein [Flavobacterium sp. W20_MBD1_R3]|uniref:DUF7689 domain-containing protein n=1 Tax=Flavobacterium sp. W20_MBD1_R3 TaxID=3240278 RepID=UPI003F8E3BED
MSHIEFPKQFPNSSNEPFLITSDFTNSYNCIAWAFGDNTKWYWPDPTSIYYWPEGVPRLITIDSFIDLYRTIDYTICEDGDYEIGYEKIAIFISEIGEPTHASRLLPNGYWTSKLGPNIDVSHSIYSIEDGDYGNVSVYMKRVNVNFK